MADFNFGDLLNIHRRHSNLGHRAMAQIVFLPRPEIIYIITPFSLLRPEVTYICALVDFSPDWRQCKYPYFRIIFDTFYKTWNIKLTETT